MARHQKKRLILLALIVFVMAPVKKVLAANNPGRIALLVNVAVKNARREYMPEGFQKISRILKTHFDKVIIMDNSRKGKSDLIPNTKNVRKKIRSIGRSSPDFLFVYYLGYGKSNRIAFDGKYLSRNVFNSWIEDAVTNSFTIIDVLGLSSGFSEKKTTISPLKTISPDSSHCYLLNRRKGFLKVFEEVISARYKTDLNLKKLYRLITRHQLTNIHGNVSSIETVPEFDTTNDFVIVFKSPEELITSQDIKIPPLKTISKKIARSEASGKLPRKPVAAQVVKHSKKAPIKSSYFKRVNFKSELKVFDLQKISAGADPINGNDIMPFLSNGTLFGINANNGFTEWKIPVDKKYSEYGINFVDEWFIFVLLQNELDGSGLLKVIERDTGIEVNSLQIWGNLAYYQPYQHKFVTARISENYFSFLVTAKPGRVSEIKKIVYDADVNKLSIENYNIDYRITSPLRYHPDSGKIYWGGKKKATILLGCFNLRNSVRKDFILKSPAKDIDYTGYVIEDSPLILPSGYTNLPHTLCFFVSLNKRSFSLKGARENLIAIYKLKVPGGLVKIDSFPDRKLFYRLLEEKILKNSGGNTDYAYFDLTIGNEDLLKKRLKNKGIGQEEEIINIWRQIPRDNLKISRHNLFKIKGRLISSPALFKDPQVHNLNYVYFFSAFPPTDPDKTGMQNVLTLFEPYFWQKGVFLGTNHYPVGGLGKRNLLGIPLIFKRDSDYLMLMASDEVYVYSYDKDSSGQKTWTRNYRYNNAVRKGLNPGRSFYGICSSPIQRINDVYLVKSTYRGHPSLYGFKLVKHKPADEEERANYGIEFAWIFDGGNSISAPLAYLKNSDELSVVAEGKLLGIRPGAFAKSGEKQSRVNRIVSIPGHALGKISRKLSPKPFMYQDNLYWVSSSSMFTLNPSGSEDHPFIPVKFADISKKITTGISFSQGKFCYGTENNGIEIYTFNKDTYYSFFKLDARVSSTPVLKEDMVYFATSSEKKNYFYGMKLDSENYFILPNPGWDIQDMPVGAPHKTFTSTGSWKFNIKNARMVARPTLGQIGKKNVVFAGTTGGMIYAFDQKGKRNKKGEITQPDWKYKLPRIDEGTTSPLVFDPINKVLYCMGDKGRLYVLDPSKSVKAILASFSIAETDDFKNFKPTNMTLAQGNLCFSVTSKKQESVFYCLNYKGGKYLRIPLPQEVVFEPLIVGNKVFVSCRSGEIYTIEIPPSFFIKSPTRVAPGGISR